MGKDRNFPITSKTLTNKDIITTFEEEDATRLKIIFTLQNYEPPKNNLSKNEHRFLKKLRSDDSIVVLPDEKGRVTAIIALEDYSKMYE